MNQNWLWDKKITEDDAKKFLQDTLNPEFISYAALLLSQKNSAKEVFKEYLKQKDFVIFWQRIKKQMRKNSWNDPRIEYWQAIYETLKAKSLEFAGLREEKNQQFYSPLLKEIGLTIKNEREKKGITQKELAFNLKISQQIISRIEKGKQNISIETLEKICNALGLPIDIEKFGFKKDAKLSIILSRYVFPFWSKTPEEFENLCYVYLKRSKEYNDVTLNRGIGDKGRDIIGYKFSTVGGKKKWYFQCKNYERISYKDFKKEIDKIKKHSDEIENFKPDKIIFITACPFSPECRDKTKEYANNLGLNEIEIWNDVELTERVESIKGLKEEFFPVGITKEDLKEATGDIKQEFKIIINQQLASIAESDTNKKDKINKGINISANLIDKNEIEKAKEILFGILGKIKDRPDKFRDELVKVYNNLGVCYILENNFVKSKEYIDKVLELDSEFIPAKTNLSSIYLNICGNDNDQKAYEIVNELWVSNKKDIIVLHNLIQSICNYKSPKEAILFYENSEEAKSLVMQNDKLLNLLGRIYLFSREFDKAIEFADKALELSPMKIWDVITNLKNKNFETAYNMFTDPEIWNMGDYKEKVRIAEIFLQKGAPEQSINILKQLELEAEQKKDVWFWIAMSTNAVLLEEKNLALNSAQKVKEFSSGSEFEKTTLSHFNALMHRYCTDGEVDRWMKGLYDYNQKYPEEKILVPINAIDEKGKPSEEIKTILSDQQKKYENVKKEFQSKPIPSYWLEKIFKIPYASILSLQYDPEFLFPFFGVNEQQFNKLTDNLEKARNLVFDYASLLNLAKMNLLSHLEKLNKNIFISEELFI
ncbi:MAG: helix-turn-helix domain-containing protein, partial [Candidatus Firestonebacteria bacterium]|nr:helix-turn-helix domain-containing protein [Candidatus Firestonebacteria bacterium]